MVLRVEELMVLADGELQRASPLATAPSVKRCAMALVQLALVSPHTQRRGGGATARQLWERGRESWPVGSVAVRVCRC